MSHIFTKIETVACFAISVFSLLIFAGFAHAEMPQTPSDVPLQNMAFQRILDESKTKAPTLSSFYNSDPLPARAMPYQPAPPEHNTAEQHTAKQSAQEQSVADPVPPWVLESAHQAFTTEPAAGNALEQNAYIERDLQEPAIKMDDEYALGRGDVLQITVYGEPGLTNTYRVSEDGVVSLPFIGDVPAAGRSIGELEAEIHLRLSDGYLLNPNVSINMMSVRPFFILGEVRLPGRYDYAPNMTALKAVAVAGGYTYRANKKDAKLLRANSGRGVYEEVPMSEEIFPGDIILIKERFF